MVITIFSLTPYYVRKLIVWTSLRRRISHCTPSTDPQINLHLSISSKMLCKEKGGKCLRNTFFIASLDMNPHDFRNHQSLCAASLIITSSISFHILTSFAELFPQLPRKIIFFPPPALSLHISTSFVAMRPVKTTPKLKHLRSSNSFPQRPTFLIISSLYVSVPHSNTTDRFFLVKNHSRYIYIYIFLKIHLAGD